MSNEATPINKELDGVKRKTLRKKNVGTIKFNHEKVVSSKFKFLEHMSSNFKKKYVKDRIKEIKKLPDYEKIHSILNNFKKDEVNPCHYPDRKKESTVFWNSYSYLMKQIERCILTNNWTSLTQCLLVLKDAPKYYYPYLLKASFINCMVNPASVNNNILENFLQECLSCHTEEDMVKLIESQFTLVHKEDKLPDANKIVEMEDE